ncbi:sugar transferase [Trichothermofontia sichuanensis B231]|uniref:sugar transferase n=1 Tax=Trichothermofontia sichuanensis TaxID=3045816 RepID=UPI00224763D5|nr:sugar transferase [Trichothermofontia sichuanensis]UZQ56129.1 sugar transferase [Trichothermofontia sichuanensis B231]
MFESRSYPHANNGSPLTPVPWLPDIRAPQRWSCSPLQRQRWLHGLALLLSDAIALAVAWRIAAHLNQFYSPIPAQLVWWVWWGLPSLFWVFAATVLLVLAWNGLYSTTGQWKNFLRAGQLVSYVYLASLVVSYFYDPLIDPPRSLFFSAWFASVLLVVGFRLLTTLGLRQVEQSQPVAVFLIAPRERLAPLTQTLQRRAHYRVVGTALPEQVHTATTAQAILATQAQEVLAEGLPEADLASSLYWQLRRVGVNLRLLPTSLSMLHRRGEPEVLAGLPTLKVEAPLFSGLDYQLKRCIDFWGALLGLILLAPLFLGVAIAIKLTSSGPVFFRQERMGLHGKIFQMWKFRTMTVDAPQLQDQLESLNQSQDGIMFKIKHDPRVTVIGRWLRHTSIDELPQLINVLRGEMSLVGPRPLPLRDIQRFAPWHHTRHQVLPGITGLWQVSGRSDIDTFDDAVRLDLYYIDNWSLNLDLDILLETCRIILFGRGAY